MKYMILKKRTPPSFETPALDYDDDPFLELAGAKASSSNSSNLELPYEIDSEDLDDHSLGERLRDPLVEDVVLSIPFTLIQPVSVQETSLEDMTEWGINAVGALSSPYSGEGVRVAVLDTGIDREHPAFSGVKLEEMDFTSDNRGVLGSAPDKHGHGTHCAGTIFGREVNGKRIGVAPGITHALIGKVLGPKGGPTEAIYNAIEWALRKKADIISMSLGIDFPGIVTKLTEHGLPEDIAVSRALEGYRSNMRMFDRLSALIQARGDLGHGALIISASGNESRRGENPKYTVGTQPPAAADGFTSVGAISKTKDLESPFAIAPFSNTGCLLAAPGVSIESANLGGGLKYDSGTSMATPHVAGVAALWTQKLFSSDRPKNWEKDVQRALESHVRVIPGISRNDVGLGLVQAPQ